MTMAKCPSSYFPKNTAKVVLIAGAGALAYVGYKYYKTKVENATKKVFTFFFIETALVTFCKFATF